MRKLIYLFILLITQLHAADETRLAAESEPLLTIANCVNLMGGAFFQVDQDLVVDGPLPLSFTRHYDSGDRNEDNYYFNHYGYGVGLGSPLFIKYSIYPGNDERIYVDQRHRYGVPFRITSKGKTWFKAGINPCVYKWGYSNCTAALERGQPCLTHTELSVTNNSTPLLEVTDADGTKRTYTYFTKKSETLSLYYLLRRTDHPNGLTTHNEYDDNGRIKLMALKNTADNELLTSIAYNYDDQNNKFTLQPSIWEPLKEFIMDK